MATWWQKQQSIAKGKAYDKATALETWGEMKKTQYETTFKRWLASTVLQEPSFVHICIQAHEAWASWARGWAGFRWQPEVPRPYGVSRLGCVGHRLYP